MKLEKAIEILKDELPYLEPDYGPDFIEAVRLGIAALGQFVILRQALPIFKGVLLPGETKD